MQKQESINLKSTIKSLTTESYATKSNSNERPETNSFSLKNKLNELTGKEWIKLRICLWSTARLSYFLSHRTLNVKDLIVDYKLMLSCFCMIIKVN